MEESAKHIGNSSLCETPMLGQFVERCYLESLMEVGKDYEPFKKRVLLFNIFFNISRSRMWRRYYTHTQYLEYVGNSSKQEENKRKVVIYARVSNRGQKDDLVNQIEFLKQYANAKGMIVDRVLEDIGRALNYNRKKWNKLLMLCRNSAVKQILIAHKDRFIRFGYTWFEEFLKSYRVELVVVNNEKLSLEQELVQDLISITHVFSCRIYGLRKYKKKMKEEGELLCELTEPK